MTKSHANHTHEFLAEAEDIVGRVTQHLIDLDRGLAALTVVDALYRDMHSLKGGAQLLGFKQIGMLAHVMESALEPIRGDEIPFTSQMIQGISRGLDSVRRHLAAIRRHGHELSSNDEVDPVIPRLIEITTSLLTSSGPAVRDDAPIDTRNKPIDTARSGRGSRVEQVETQKNEILAKEQMSTQRRPANPSASKDHWQDASSAESVRVSIGILDKLMNLVGELVLIRNQVIQIDDARQVGDEFRNLSQSLSVVTSELQNEVMKTRMQPIDNVVDKLHRVVRDMARELGKSVEVVLEGMETELDKTLIEAIKDPLNHIVRNAIDHGFESSEERLAANKPKTGTLTVRSYHEGGHVIIEVADDGRGLSRARIAAKAAEKGLATHEALERMSDREIQRLIFLPGFSTAEQVTNFSGRGVGMDVVRTNIERIGGLIDISSVAGQGTTIRLKIPLTLAIIPALIIRCNSERFAIPQVALVELVRVELHSADTVRGIEMLQGSPIFRLRGQILPLVSLAESLGLQSASAIARDSLSIVVLNAGHGQFGIIVDEIVDSVDIVVKPLPIFLKSLNVFSGTTVLGDGSVVLTLDVAGIATRAGMFDQNAPTTRSRWAEQQNAQMILDTVDYLIVDLGGPSRFALPLCLIKRLEEFKRSAIEMAGGHRVVRYRDGVLPLLNLAEQLVADRADPVGAAAETVHVVVIERNEQLFGLQVERVMDVIATDAALDTRANHCAAMLGTCIYQEEIFVVVDVYGAIDHYRGIVNDAVADTSRHLAVRKKHHILLVDDSAFFRGHVSRLLTDAGYLVTTATDGKEGLERLSQSPGSYGLVLSDIEMPRMNGLELARQIKQSEATSTLPLVAISTRFRKADQAEGEKAGFARYLEKLNPDQLIETIDSLLGIRGKSA